MAIRVHRHPSHYSNILLFLQYSQLGTVLAYIKAVPLPFRQGISGCANRFPLNSKGNRLASERAFGVEIHGYRIGPARFFANAADPLQPSELAQHVAAVAGPSHLARPQPLKKFQSRVLAGLPCAACAVHAEAFPATACKTALKTGNS